MNNKLLRIKYVCETVSLSKSYIYQLVSKDQFPKPVQIVEGGSAKAWVESEVIAWVNSRIADRDNNVGVV